MPKKKIDYSKFRLSLKRLKEQHENYLSLDTGLPVLFHEGIAESVIRRFRICYDCLWKVLRKYLIEGLGIAEIPSSSKSVIRLAHENNMFSSPPEQWFLYADARTSTSHDYGEKFAETTLHLLPAFLADAKAFADMIEQADDD